MKRDEATPRPWRTMQHEGMTSKSLVALLGDGWRVLAIATDDPIVWKGQDAANAALIVRAVNAHDSLVAALKAFQHADALSPKTGRREAFRVAWAEAREALKLAEPSQAEEQP